MSDKTRIEWTEATWNPVTGCTKVSQGCKHCYAERDWARLVHLPAYQGRAFTDVVCHPERLDQPMRWKRPRRIFVNSMSDLFHEAVPDAFIDEVFAVMTFSPRHTFQVLTKRPARMLEYMRRDQVTPALRALAPKARGLPWQDGERIKLWPRPNICLGVSVEDQETADELIPLLLQTPAAVRWISAEPLLGAVDLTQFLVRSFDEAEAAGHYGLDWVVAGGESGPKARPMNPVWARNIRDQCNAAGVPFLFKQWGEWYPVELLPKETSLLASQWAKIPDDGATPYKTRLEEVFVAPVPGHAVMGRIGKKAAGRLLDGVLHDGYPQEGGAA